MLQSIQQLCGDKLGALDGKIGHVKDFYFDSQNWAVRYLVADMGNWLPGRQVLLSPYSLVLLDEAEKLLLVNLTRKQIEGRPSIDSHKAVSQQHEYGWPYYWLSNGLGNMKVYPILELPVNPSSDKTAIAKDSPKSGESHLRSVKVVNGYAIQAIDGSIGHLSDFMMDTRSWVIRYLVVKTGNLFSGKEVQIPMSQVGRISDEESTLFVKLTRKAVERSFPRHRVPVGAAN